MGLGTGARLALLGRAALVACLAVSFGHGCAETAGPDATGGERSGATAPGATGAPVSARAPDRPSASALVADAPRERPTAADEASIAWPLATLRSVGEPTADTFSATDAAGRQWTLVLASLTQPRPDRRPHAYARVARALGFTIVADSSVARLSVGELGELLRAQPDALARLQQRATVENDGRVVARLHRPCSGRPLDVASNEQVARWRKLAESPTPVAGAQEPLVAGYVEMVVLDYLTGNVAGRSLWWSPDGARTCLEPQPGAFPGFLPPVASDQLLARVRSLAHFPLGLEPALERLDRSAARELLMDGPFAHWLVGPRDVADLVERRDTLLSLLRARRGPAPAPAASATAG